MIYFRKIEPFKPLEKLIHRSQISTYLIFHPSLYHLMQKYHIRLNLKLTCFERPYNPLRIPMVIVMNSKLFGTHFIFVI